MFLTSGKRVKKEKKTVVSDLTCPKEVYAAQCAEVKPLVIDARGPKEYAADHVLGR